MTRLLDKAVQKVRALPAEMQDQAARMLLAYAGDDEPLLELTPDEEADIREAVAEVARGELASVGRIRSSLAITSSVRATPHPVSPPQEGAGALTPSTSLKATGSKTSAPSAAPASRRNRAPRRARV